MGRWSPQARANMSRVIKAQWANPELRAKRLEALARSRRGRPRLDGDSDIAGPSKQVSARMSPGDVDLLYQVAAARSLTMAELIREYIEDGLAKDVHHHYYKASQP